MLEFSRSGYLLKYETANVCYIYRSIRCRLGGGASLLLIVIMISLNSTQYLKIVLRTASFHLSRSFQVLTLDEAIPHDSYAWTSRELPALHSINGSFADGGFEPLTIGSMGKHLTTEIS